jgi:hypothetical protein
MAYRNLILFCCFFFFSKLCFGAACCAGSSSLPTLITGDYRYQFAFSFINSASTHYVNEEGFKEARDGSNQEIKETINLSGAVMLSPLLQIGASLPFKMNTHKNIYSEEKSSGVGDLHLTSAYEFYPEYSFSYFKPRAFVFLDQTIPLGRSSFESQKIRRTDSTSRGFYSTSLGLALIKQIKTWDLLFMTEYHRSLKRQFEGNESLEVRPGFGYSSLLSLGYAPFTEPWRVGVSFGVSFEEGAELVNLSEKQSDKYSTEAGLSLSYLLHSYLMSVNYKDQTLLSWYKNTTLDKSIVLSLIKFYEL